MAQITPVTSPKEAFRCVQRHTEIVRVEYFARISRSEKLLRLRHSV